MGIIKEFKEMAQKENELDKEFKALLEGGYYE